MTTGPRQVGRLVLIGLIAALAFTALVALGVWQVERLAWKRDLIARVEARLHRTPVDPPIRAVTDEDAYLRVRLLGVYLPGHDSFVQASTVKGPGYWVMTPLRRADGRLFLINRGFVAKRVASPPSTRPIFLIGLLRISEPGGGFLRANDPKDARWYSRDVVAIAGAQGLGNIAPYFIDADAASTRKGGPIGGLTVVRFANNHLVYALTWFALALMVAGAGVWLLRGAWRDGAQPAMPT